MDQHVYEFYRQVYHDAPCGNFRRVIALHEDTRMSWESVSQLCPKLCKGWYELAHLSIPDRIEFTCEFWLSKLPYHPKLDLFLSRFFGSLDDIGVFVVQQKYDDPYDAHLIYSFRGDNGFYRGALPADEEDISRLQETFSDFILPADYLAFLQIHNGFWKTTDITGITPTTKMENSYRDFQGLLAMAENPLTTNRGTAVEPKKLIPFYESFGMPFFQCFWAEWYPEQEMGNVYYSGITQSISDVESNDPSAEGMAFPTFLDWLMFYMERIA